MEDQAGERLRPAGRAWVCRCPGLRSSTVTGSFFLSPSRQLQPWPLAAPPAGGPHLCTPGSQGKDSRGREGAKGLRRAAVSAEAGGRRPCWPSRCSHQGPASLAHRVGSCLGRPGPPGRGRMGSGVSEALRLPAAAGEAAAQGAEPRVCGHPTHSALAVLGCPGLQVTTARPPAPLPPSVFFCSLLRLPRAHSGGPRPQPPCPAPSPVGTEDPGRGAGAGLPRGQGTLGV